MKQVPFQDINSPNSSPQSQQNNQFTFIFVTCGVFGFIFLMLTLPFYSSFIDHQNNVSLIPIVPVQEQWQRQNIFAGEIQYPRIPVQYWEHRIQMIKSMGLNALSIYIFWNFHQIERGVFDFQTQRKNLTKFLELAQKHKMKVLIRPGPYVCAQWDLGGLPARLLSIQGIQLRAYNQIYLSQVKIYFEAVAPILKPFLVKKNQQKPTIILFQIQNQYGFVGTDKGYINQLRKMWMDLGIQCQFYYVDWIQNVQKSYWQGASIGINNGYSPRSYQYTRIFNKNGKIFGGQIYSGWFTRWGDQLKGKSIEQFLDEYQQILFNNHSFAMYMVHGGTSFGLSAGANQVLSLDTLKFYAPLATTYDYDAPISEQGRPNKKYFQFKKLLSYYIDYQVPQAPQNIKLMNVNEFIPSIIGTIFNSSQFEFPAIVSSQKLHLFESQQLKMFNQGIVLYQTIIFGHNTFLFELSVSDLAIVYLDQKPIKVLNRTQLQNHTLNVTCQLKQCKMVILVEAMGHVNFGPNIQNDKKGIKFFKTVFEKQITQNKSEDSQNMLKQQKKRKNSYQMQKLKWNMYKIQLEKKPQWKKIGKCESYPCLFEAQIELNQTSDTYLNLSRFQKGYVWVNGHNLGRFWNIGPTYNLFCPGVWLKIGKNTITILDILNSKTESVWGTTQSQLIYRY